MLSFIKNIFHKLTHSTSKDEDKARREFILNVLLLSIVGLSATAFIINFLRDIYGASNAMPTGITFIIMSFFIFLYLLSKKGFTTLTSIIFLTIFFILNSHTAISYGADIPQGLLVYALIIVMSGILLGTIEAFITTIITASFVFIVGYLQIESIISTQSYWRSELLIKADIILITAILLIIATVSWLSNREIEKSLKRARDSEKALKKERDLLEITVEERTKELKEAQAEKMAQLYRFAEFGKISSGVFHDLVNPLNAVSLNIEKLKNNSEKLQISETAKYIESAIRSANKLETLISAVRKQLIRKKSKTIFSLNEEIEYVIDVLSHKAKKNQVTINFSASENIEIYGEAIKFNQVILNLVVNGIESCINNNKNEKIVNISIHKENQDIILEVIDSGVGISEEILPKIFEPFFTTKTKEGGIGLGLSMTKSIVEKDFNGSINVSSKPEETIFKIKIPQKNEGSN